MRILLSREIEEAMLVGVNVDPQHWSTDELIRIMMDGKFEAIRTVLLPHDIPRQRFLNMCRDYGIKVCGVIARESFPENLRGSGFRPSLKNLLRFYSDSVHYLQIGNEPDSDGPSSWTMKQGSLTALAKAVAITNHGRCKLIGPGLTSGHPSFMLQNGEESKRPRLWVNMVSAMAIHPYGQSVFGSHPAGWSHGQMSSLLENYETAFGYPCSYWITEFGAHEGSESDIARYYSDCLGTFLNHGIEAAFAFCLSDRMVQGYGLLDVDNQPKERWAAIIDSRNKL